MDFKYPPIIERQSGSEKDRYMRASPERRARMVADLEQQTRKAESSLVATATEELQYAFGGRLPSGEYRNPRGDSYVVSPNDWRPKLHEKAPVVLNHRWVPMELPWLMTRPSGVPPKYRFLPGDWAPEMPIAYPFAALIGAQQQHQPPPGLEGARFIGILSPMPQQYQSVPADWLSQQPSWSASAAYGGQHNNFAALQQPTVAASSQHQPPLCVAHTEEQPSLISADFDKQVPLPATDEGQQPSLSPSLPAAPTQLLSDAEHSQLQQTVDSTGVTEEQLDDEQQLATMLQHWLHEEDAREEWHRTRMERWDEGSSDSPYVGYASATQI